MWRTFLQANTVTCSGEYMFSLVVPTSFKKATLRKYWVEIQTWLKEKKKGNHKINGKCSLPASLKANLGTKMMNPDEYFADGINFTKTNPLKCSSYLKNILKSPFNEVKSYHANLRLVDIYLTAKNVKGTFTYKDELYIFLLQINKCSKFAYLFYDENRLSLAYYPDFFKVNEHQSNSQQVISWILTN